MIAGSYSFAEQHSSSGLAHLSYHCPGLHGPGAAKQDIGRQTFRDMLGEGKPLMRVPPFQRTYCWSRKLAADWWRDARSGSHSTGKAIYCPVAGSDPRVELLVVDGQQRLTTTCLCVSAIRDEALRSASAAPFDVQKLASACDAVLFRDVPAARVWLNRWCADDPEVLPGGWSEVLPPDDGALPFLSLVPTLRDRQSFQQMVLGGRLGLKPTVLTGPMAEVRAAFDEVVRGLNLKQLATSLWCILDGMNVMSMKVLDPPPGLARQVFQWAQEKSLAAEVMVRNPQPGVCLCVSDLVRNLVLAPLLERSAAEMEDVLRQHWIPLEQRFVSPILFDAFLLRFVEADPRAAVSESAAPMLAMADASAASTPDSDLSTQLHLYARVLCEYDAIVRTQSVGDRDCVALISALSGKLCRFADGGLKEEHDICGRAQTDVDTAAMPPPPPPSRRA